MATERNQPSPQRTEAEWYDLSIDWAARLSREIPVLMSVFGASGNGGILDAGCGTGHQATALAERGYRVVGADIDDGMLAIARRQAAAGRPAPTWTKSAYADLHAAVGGGFDGVYCLANSLAAAGSRDAVREAVRQFSKCLRLGGRLFVQVLNFEPMRREVPCIRGPRVTSVDGVEHVSIRQFHFVGDRCQVTNITLWRDTAWRFHTHARNLYPVSESELRQFCAESSLRIDALWGGYDCKPFDPAVSADLIVVATRS